MKATKLIIHISLALLMLFSTTRGFCEEKTIESKWTAQPPKIDGLNDEWGADVLTSEKSVKVDFAVRNDPQNLYLLFVFKDPKFLSTINATGITLYFNREGKNKKDNGFRFIKKQVTPDEFIARWEKQGGVLTEEQRKTIEAKASLFFYDVETVGKKAKETTETPPVPGTLRPAFRTTQKENEVIYEFRVPLAKSEAYPEGIGVEPGQNVKIGFEWGGITEEMRKMMNAQARAQGTGVNKESGSGSVINPLAGEGGAPGGSSMAIPKRYSFWVGVKLAQSQ